MTRRYDWRQLAWLDNMKQQFATEYAETDDRRLRKALFEAAKVADRCAAKYTNHAERKNVD